MEKRVMIHEMDLKSDILSESLADNLAIDASQLPPPNNGINYELTVDFSHERIHDEAQIMAFPVEDRPYIKNSNYRDRLGHALSKQLSNIESRFIGLGYDIVNCSINGQAFEETNKIIIRLFEGKAKEFDKKGKPKEMKVYSIAPSVPGLNKIIRETFAELALRQMKELELAAKKKEKHIPNNVAVRELFELIACGIVMDQRIPNEQQDDLIQEATSHFMANFKVGKEWPLDMSGHVREISKDDCTVHQVDCSEWMVYSQGKDGSWTLNSVESAEMARNVVEKGIVNKSIETIVVLHDLLPVSFALMAQDRFGLSLIEKKDAPLHKRVQVVWRNAV